MYKSLNLFDSLMPHCGFAGLDGLETMGMNGVLVLTGADGEDVENWLRALFRWSSLFVTGGSTLSNRLFIESNDCLNSDPNELTSAATKSLR